jgi:hypothetical protein
MATQSRSNIPNTRSFQPLSGMISSQFELPEGLAQSIQQPYITNGLTYKSNNKFVMQRDDAGNIVLDATADKIQNLIIEPNIERITNKSVVEVFNTQFNYFKFPAKTKNTGAFGAFDIGDIDLGIEDLISGHYVAPELVGSGGYPSVSRKLPTSYDSSWDARSGPQRLDFTSATDGPPQSTPGTFTLLPDMIEQLKENNTAVKFTVVLSCRRDYSNDANTGFNMIIQRTMPTRWRSNDNPAADPTFSIYNVNARPNVYKTTGAFGTYISLKLEYIIDPDDMFEYDKYEILAAAGGPGWWDGSMSYWNIQVIPDPGLGNYGIQLPSRNPETGQLNSSLGQHIGQ